MGSANSSFWRAVSRLAKWTHLARLRLIGLLAMALLLPACSTLKLVYNQAPELAYWYFDAYADFNDAQSLQVKAELTRLQAWHRQTQLPGYSALLQDAQRQVRGDITPAQACAVFADVRGKLVTVGERAEPAAALLAASLEARQLQQMERRFAKGNAEYRKDFLDGTPQARRTHRLDKAIHRAEMLYGRLDDRQTALLGRMIDQSGFDASRSYGERLRRQKDILETVRQLTGPPAASAMATASPAADPASRALNGLIKRAIHSPDAAYRAYAEKQITDGCKSFAEFHNATSAAQRDKAAATLNGYEKDLATLAGQGG
ncbi:MAG: hypothetical protein JWR68_2635 [Polaromonas sp.]|nr:hypothetical protein [Polaromonas sp.]